MNALSAFVVIECPDDALHIVRKEPVIHIRPDPNQRLFGLAVDVVHHSNLLCLLSIILLVYAQLVDPDPWVVFKQPKPLQEVEEVATDRYLKVIDRYRLVYDNALYFRSLFTSKVLKRQETSPAVGSKMTFKSRICGVP